LGLSQATTETARAPWILAADGAHSAVRRSLGIAFAGGELDEEWHLADAPLETALEQDRAHAFLRPRGEFLFLVRAVDGASREPGTAPLWRVIGNRPRPLDNPRVAEVAGEPAWTSSFTIAHRIAAELSRGGVHLAGDAAHVHSPIGARGMNLGIEDARVFAKLARAGRPERYGAERRRIDAGFVRRRLLATVAGPDHELLETLEAAAARGFMQVRQSAMRA